MTNTIITAALSAVLALGATEAAVAQTSAKDNKTASQNEMQMVNLKGMEKCYGIAKAGQNDCGTASHGCASESKINNDKEAWIAVPTGLCNKIVGGSLIAPEPIKS